MNKDQRIQTMEQETAKVRDPHRQFNKLRFEDNSMDFAFQWALGGVSNGGGTIGEMFYTANQIEDYNPDSWAAEWPRMREKMEQRAKDSENGGHKVSAREFYLRASYYYRAALTTLLPQNTEFMRLYNKSIECFTKAGALSDPQIEMISVPFEGTTLPGCLIKAKTPVKNKKLFLPLEEPKHFLLIFISTLVLLQLNADTIS